MLRILLVVLALGPLACGPRHLPAHAVADLASDASGSGGVTGAELPLDPGVHTGKLDNGLTWYVEPNQYPDARAELRLVVDVGSVVEDEDQRGLAHVLEHMAFNGSKSFPEGELVKWFESVGMSFGAHLNAYTSFDQTVYTITVPTTDPEVLARGLLVLREWADGLSLEDAAIERERGVVLEEWRTGLGAQDRIFQKLAPLYYAGSPYADRLPIGTEKSLRTFTPDAVRRFYRDWYRADRMAVIAVGDFDAAAVEASVRDQFADMAKPAGARPRVWPAIPAHDAPLVAIVTDPELTEAWVTVTAKVDDTEDRTDAGYRTKLAEDLLVAILNERFDDLSRKPGAPLGGGGGGFQRWSPTEGAWSVGASVRNGDSLAALDALLTEVERLRQHGVTQAELDRARARTLQAYDQYWRERDQERSDNAADELVRAFVNGETVPGIQAEVDMARAWLPTMTREELGALARTWMPASSRVVELGVPASKAPGGKTPGGKTPGAAAPTEAEVHAAIARVAASTIAPPAEEAAGAPLLDPLPKPGAVAARGEVKELGVTTWTLSNGVEVWIKPTDFKAGEVLLGAWSPGGRSLAPDAQWVPARAAETLRARSGLGTLDRSALEKRLAGVDASASTSIGRFNEGVSGTAAADDVETMLQLVHLQFTQPRFEASALDWYRADAAERIARRGNAPENVFDDAVEEATWQGHLRMRPWTLDDLGKLDLAASEAFRKARFANAADFRFLIVGDVDMKTLEPLVARYLGSLPASAAREKAADDGARRVTTPVDKVVHAGQDPKARVRLTFHGPFEGGWTARNRLQALSGVLEVRLREELREERGGVYGVSVSDTTWVLPTGGYALTVDFACDPARVAELETATREVLDELRGAPVDARYVEAHQVAGRRGREESARTNAFWLSGILAAQERGEDPRGLLDWDARNDSLTPQEVHAAAKKYLDPARTIRTELRPVEAGAAPVETKK